MYNPNRWSLSHLPPGEYSVYGNDVTPLPGPQHYHYSLNGFQCTCSDPTCARIRPPPPGVGITPEFIAEIKRRREQHEAEAKEKVRLANYEFMERRRQREFEEKARKEREEKECFDKEQKERLEKEQKEREEASRRERESIEKKEKAECEAKKVAEQKWHAQAQIAERLFIDGSNKEALALCEQLLAQKNNEITVVTIPVWITSCQARLALFADDGHLALEERKKLIRVTIHDLQQALRVYPNNEELKLLLAQALRYQEALFKAQKSSEVAPITPAEVKVDAKETKKQEPIVLASFPHGFFYQPLAIPPQALTFDRELGRGRFSTVYVGTLRRGNDIVRVAIKKLFPHIGDADFKQFNTEATILMQLRHKNICEFCGISKGIDGCYSLIMHYVPNKSLHDVLQVGGTAFNEEKSPYSLHWRIAMDIAEGLAYLHANRILHRDIKSLNILLDIDFHAKICDFGLAKNLTAAQKSSIGVNTFTVGSVPWMAPELLGLRPKYTEKSDVYAFGVVLWELWTSQSPYQDAEPTVIRDCVLKGEREEVPEICPPFFAKLIKECWAQNPADRPSMLEVVEQLKINMPRELTEKAAKDQLAEMQEMLMHIIRGVDIVREHVTDVEERELIVGSGAESKIAPAAISQSVLPLPAAVGYLSMGSSAAMFAPASSSRAASSDAATPVACRVRVVEQNIKSQSFKH